MKAGCKNKGFPKLFQLSQFIAIHLIVAKTFYLFHLLIRINRLRPMNICTKLDVEIIHRKSENFDLLVVLEENSVNHKVIKIHLLGIMDICTKFHENPFIC